MSTEAGQQGVPALLPAMVIFLGALLTMTKSLSALELKWSAQARALASDNIRRDASDAAAEGAVRTILTSVSLEGERGQKSFSLMARGGFETLVEHSAAETENQTYLIRSDFKLPLVSFGHLEGIVESSEETSIPETSTDPLQTRALTRRDEARLAGVYKPSGRTEWQVRAGWAHEQRPQRDRVETNLALASELPLGRRSATAFEVMQLDGSEDISEDSWRVRSCSLALTRQSDRLVSSGIKADWQESCLESGLLHQQDQSNRLGAVAFFDFRIGQGWTTRYEMGLDGLRSDSGVRTWETRVDLSLLGDLSPTTTFDLSLSSVPELRDAREGTVQSARIAELEASIAWRPSRTATITPLVSYRIVDPFEGGANDRVDKNSYGEVRVDWAPHSSWGVSMVGAAQVRDSTLDTARFEENRVEIVLTGALF